MENRYDKYKDSGIAWIGEIPEHWSKNKIARLFGIIGSGTTPKSNKEDNYIGSINWIQSGDINGSYIKKCKNTISEVAIKEYPILKIYKAPFIIVAMYGASVGNISISEIDACVNQACCVMNDSKQNFKYLFYAINSVKKYLIYKAEGGGQPNISQDKIKNTWMPVPPTQEQQFIAAYLDQKCGEIDELIALQEEMITKLQSYKQSVITEAVTKGLDKNVPLKDSGIEWIGTIPAHWICAVFKKFLSDPMQYGANEPAEECNYNDPRYIRITDIKDDGTLRDDTFKSLSLDKAKEYMLVKGDLLFARSGATVGKTFLYNEDYTACFAGYLIKARCNKNELIPNFVFYYTLSNVYQNWKNSIFIQSTIQNIGADKYSLMPIIVPPISEQQTIADYLDQKCSEIDELISIKQQKIEKLKDYKKSLIFECVTGKRKV